MASSGSVNRATPNQNDAQECVDPYTLKLNELLPFMLDKDLQSIKKGLKPSEILEAFKLTTEERLEALKNPMRKYRVGTKKDSFVLCPEAIVFQSYEVGITYKTTLTVTNQKATPKNLKTYFETTRYFTFSMDPDCPNLTKVAPGMSKVFTLTFMPAHPVRDYVHKIYFSWEDGNFTVPIFGIGPRPIVCVPDKIILPPTLVKVESVQVITLKNRGALPLTFSHNLPKPFSCDILKGTILPNEVLELRYSCYPPKPGRLTIKSEIYCVHGLTAVMELECEVDTVKVNFDSIRTNFEDVFMGMCAKKFVTLYNTSEYPLNFAWKMYEQDKEEGETLKLVQLMEAMKEFEKTRYAKLKYMEIVDGKDHAAICERIFEDEKEDLTTKQTFLYKSDFFQIIPLTGKIPPNSQFEFLVIFAPRQNIFYHSSAYLDAEGGERRMQLSIQGCGIGPPVTLNVKSLHVGDIYLTAKHQYEIAVKNKGIIPATVTYEPKKPDWGGTLSCIPSSLVLGPNAIKSFLLAFSSEIQGEFLETLDFRVEESNEHLQCVFSGKVICPLLRCAPEIVNFGIVSVGVRKSKELSLINESRVPIRYDLELEQDFSEEGEKYVEIIPRHGTVQPMRTKVVEVIVCCDVTSEWKTNLLLVMWNSRLYTTKIPLSFKCATPTFICEPKLVAIKFCFLNCDYNRTVILTNETDLPGHIEYVPETEDSPIKCVPNQTKLSFNSRESLRLDLTVRVSSLGSHELPLRFSVRGGSIETFCTISCGGQGPVVSYEPDELDFGTIDVLNSYERKLTLVNDSPIAASIRVYCKENTSFHIDENDSSLVLKPEEQSQVSVWALFNNPGPAKDTIIVEIHQADPCNVHVFGEGEGTSLLCDPKLSPMLDIGTVLTYQEFSMDVKIINKGNAHHKVLFTRLSSVRNLKQVDQDDKAGVFQISPAYIELGFNQEITVKISGISKKPTTVNDLFYCHALVGKSPRIQTLMQFEVRAEFIDPSLEFSRSDIDFNVKVFGDLTEGNIKEVINMNNNTGVPFDVLITLDDSDDIFTIVNAEEKTRKTVLNQSFLSVEFHPSVSKKRKYSKNARLIFDYQNHPKTDIINLRGEVMFPTIKLYPGEVQFPCVPLGSTGVRHVVIHNVSAMMVNFKWSWPYDTVKINKIDKKRDATRATKVTGYLSSMRGFMDYVEQKVMNVDEEYNKSLSLTSERINYETMKFMYDSNQYLLEMRKILCSITTPYRKDRQSDLAPHSLEDFTDPQNVNRLFSIEPSEGFLKPYEYSIMTIGFNPPPNSEVRATVVCAIENGAEESLYLMGKSSKLSYELDKNSVDFGTQVFCELCTSHLTLTNDGTCTLDFKVILDEMITLQREMLDVNPKKGSCPSQESITFKIDYFPGIPGNFMTSFKLELGYLEPVPVEVHGYAVMSQVFLHVPRPDMELEPSDCYKAISWITPEYLNIIRSNECITENTNRPLDATLFLSNNDWVELSYDETFPSLTDVIMAMERVAMYNYIKKKSNILKDHTKLKKIPNIPNFFAAPYVIDFGYVVRDIPTCYTVVIENYGPTKADVKLIENNKTALLEQEIKIEFKPRVIVPGEVIELYVLFSPTKRKFPDPNSTVDQIINLTVRHGAIIPIHVKAEVTLPTLSVEHEELRFENIYCGDAFRKSLVITNSGNVPAKYYVTLNKPTKKLSKSVPFIIMPTEGELKPGAKSYLHIYFVPVDTKKVKQVLQIDVEMNSEPIFLTLYGAALKASLSIVPTDLNFPSMLSYFDCNMNFSITNVTDVPIEFFFPILDSESVEEKMLVEAYLKYRNLKHVFVPLRAPGGKLPELFSNTYKNLVDKLRIKMTTREGNDAETEGELSQTSAEVVKSSDKSSESEDPLLKYSTKELHSLLLEYITVDGFDDASNDNTITYRQDAPSDKVEILEAPPKVSAEETDRSAILFIFHGAPTTEYLKAASQTGIALSIPVYSLDRLIIESIVERANSNAFELYNLIDQKVAELLDSGSQLLKNIQNEESEFDQILEKIHIIMTTKPRKSPKKSPTKEKGSKASSERSQERPKDKSGDCFLNLSFEFMVDLLRPKLKTFTHLIVESLVSVFVPHPNQALYIVLTAAGALQFINLVVFSATLANLVKNQEQKHTTLSNNSPEPAQGKQGKSRPGSKQSSEKASKGSKGKSEKKMLQNLPKNLKAQFEAFETLRNELVHVAQYWDRKNTMLKKAFGSSPGSKKESAVTSKDSGRSGRYSLRKPTSNSSLNDGHPSEIGVNLWLLLNSTTVDRSVDYPEMFRNFIKTDCELKVMLDDIERGEMEKFEESETTFSVISKPVYRKNEQPPEFVIKNFQGREQPVYPVKSNSRSGSVIKVKRKRSSKESRKSSDSKPSDTALLTFAKLENEIEFTPRVIMFPGEIIRYQITFCPQKRGSYKCTYALETTKDQMPYYIKCAAICEFPHIDLCPEIMFHRTLENYREKASYDHFVFIKDQKILDFGSIIAGQSADKCLTYTTAVILRNISMSNCEVRVSLSNDIFTIDSTEFFIAPGDEKVLNLSVKSAKIGTFTARLYISIKDNPKVEEFTVACSPCKLEFSIYPKSINFDKVPVNYAAKRIIRLTNTSPINLRWEFLDSAWLCDIFDLSEHSGYMGLFSVSDIVFWFRPVEERTIPKRHLPIKVYDVNSSSEEPCFIETISVHGESVEYNLEVDDHIDYGEIKGGIQHKRNFSITNKGKSDIVLKIEMVNNPLEKQNFAREYFKVQPLLMTIGAQKSEHVVLLFHPKNSVCLSRLLLFVISMMESMQTGYVVKSYKVSVSATCSMPHYTLCPPSRLNFGYIELSKSKTLTIELTNRGKFSFSFNLLNYAKVLESSKKGKTEKMDKSKKKSAKEEKSSRHSDKKEKSEKESKKKSSTSKGSKAASSKTDKKKAAKLTKLDIGEFTLVPSSGIVEPNESCTINVELMASAVKEYSEKVLVNITEVEDLAKKNIITLEAICCEPLLNIKQIEDVFAEQFIVANIDEFELPKNIYGCCVLCLSDKTLYFKLVCINSSLKIRLHLKNIGYIPAQLSTKLDDITKSFSVNPSNKVMEAYSASIIELEFKPHSLEIATGTLEISYNATTDNKLIIYLYGRACLPQVQLLYPPLDTTGSYRLKMGPTCVGLAKKKPLIFKNVGQIKCKVIIELSTSDDILTIVPVSFNQLNVHDEDAISDMKKNIMVNLFPDEVAEFEIVHKPINAECTECNLTLHISNNPYETIRIPILTVGYNDDIILENLEPIKLSDSSRTGLVPKNPIGYLLPLGYIQLNKLYKESFQIRNRSTTDIYKFRFYCSTVSFIPEVGHLKPGAKKDVLVIFKAMAPLNRENEEIQCNICKIEYLEPDDNLLSWDDRQRFEYCMTDPAYMTYKSSLSTIDKSTKSTSSMGDERKSISEMSGPEVILEGSEPQISVLSDTLDTISLYLTVAADYGRYFCDTNFLEFQDTYVQEESVIVFQVENDGLVPINLNWHLVDKNSAVAIRRSSSQGDVTETRVGTALSLKSASSSSLFSSAASMEPEPISLPIDIDPMVTTIAPGHCQNFSVSFRPQVPNYFEAILCSRISSLDPNLEEMTIEVSARALPIPFYFQLENGSSVNRDIELDFANIGVATESVRTLLLVNPNDDQIQFEITPKDVKEFSYFVCNFPKGVIKANRKYLTTFSFRPPILGSFQEVYSLTIRNLDVRKLIVLRGICREPRIFFNKTSVTLKATVPTVKSSTTLTLRNEEQFPLSFKFVKKSLYSETHNEQLQVYPLVGKVTPQSDLDIRLTYTSLTVVNSSFNLKCLVEKQRAPLNVLVFASCVRLEARVTYTNKNGELVSLDEEKINNIDIGGTYKGRIDTVMFEIMNQGETGFFYVWEFDPKPIAHLFKISVNSEKEFVKCNSSTVASVRIEAMRTGTLKQFKMKLSISYGPVFCLQLNALADKPSYSSSFDSYDFGCCLVQTRETSYYKTVLTFKNLHSKKIMIENQFENTDFLTVKFSSSLVAPGETRNIPIKFHPQKPGSYKVDVVFLLAGNRHVIPISGEAVNIKLELSNPKDKYINFGEVLVNNTKRYKVGVYNNSLARLEVHFAFYDNLVIHKKKVESIEDGPAMKVPVLPPPPSKELKKQAEKKGAVKEKKDKASKKSSEKKSDKTKKKKDEAVDKQLEEKLAAELLQKKQAEERAEYLKAFAVIPNMFIDVPPKGKCYFDIIFQPINKIDFEEKIYFEIQNHFEPLCVIKGSSIAPEFSLDKNEISFIGVISGCSSSKYILLRNTGDILGSFSWKFEDRHKPFTIEPNQGFVLPKTDFKIKISFEPLLEKCYIEAKAKCFIKETQCSLALTLKGNSVKMPEPKATIKMTCNVRERISDSSAIVVNNSMESWLIQNEVSHEAFSVPKQLRVPSLNSLPVTVTYFPKKMTLGKPDEGTLFIKFPDGGGLVYKLVGIADAPLIKSRIEKEIRSKQNFFEILPIENWLPIKQTLKVTTEVLSPLTTKTLYKVFGYKTIELNGMERKNYKWGVYVVNEGPIDFRVTFKALTTGELEFFELYLKVLPSETIETIQFTTRVREAITRNLVLENPVDVPVTYTLECSERYLNFPKSVSLNPYTLAKVEMTYNPLHAESACGSFAAKCEELGTYSYTVKLTSEPPKPECSLTFKSELGMKNTKLINFENIFDRAVEFSYKFDNVDFHMEKCNSVAPGESTKIAINFEPSKIGPTNGTLYLTSAVAGEYIYLLEGDGVLPSPKGPYNLRLNFPTTIDFKNPFNEDMKFLYILEPDFLECDYNEDILKAKKTARFSIYVRSDSQLDLHGLVTGKLVIYPAELDELQWKYYLKLNNYS